MQAKAVAKMFGAATNGRRLIVSSRVGLAALWVPITLALSAMLYLGFGGKSAGGTVATALGVVFTLAMIWYLSRTGPSPSTLPVLAVLLSL